jgi:GTP cyclohydrolase I
VAARLINGELHGTPLGGAVDLDRIARAVREILVAVGEDPDREGLRATPARVARAYAELFAGLRVDPQRVLTTTFEAGHQELVVVRDIEVMSSCEHHLLPFHGVAHVGYIPGSDGRITGLSKLVRLVEVYARRPQVQERLTSQIADTLMARLTLAVRGIRKPGARTVTSAVRGILQHDARTRAEAMSLILGH